MDLIGYHECGRRLGVSDTAVRKAIAVGRIRISGRTKTSGRPLVDWDVVKMVWNSSGDVRKRSVIGSQGSLARKKDRPLITIPDSRHMDEAPVLLEKPPEIHKKSVKKQKELREKEPKKSDLKPKKALKASKKKELKQECDAGAPGRVINALDELTELPRSEKAGRYSDARAELEEFNAKLAQLKYETQVGTMVNAEEISQEMSKLVVAAKTRIMGIPALCKSRYSDLPLQVVTLIDQVCRETLEDLANGSGE